VNLVNIRLTPEQQRIVEAELKTGHFRTVEEVISEALQALQVQERAASALDGSQSKSVADMLAFIEANHVSLDGVTVKDLLHEDHRL
jgi:Arc/MetJ-type ribon-helix-helix transcriptional regulator